MNRVTIWLLFICVAYSARTTFAGRKCDTFLDVGFLLDSSGSITDNYDKEKDFLIALTRSLGISKTGSHAGVITFSDKSYHSIKLKDHYDMNSFSRAVRAIPLMKSGTRFDTALNLAKKELFQARNGARKHTRKLLILLTDGRQYMGYGVVDPTIVANELREMGVTVMAVGMGPGVSKRELDRITKGHAYAASTFRELGSYKFIKKLTGETCKVSKEPVPGCHVEIFTDRHFGGTRDVYRESVRQVRHNDMMSSLKLPHGCCVTIYEHANFRGRQQNYCGSISLVDRSWNNKMSSLRVSGKEPVPGGWGSWGTYTQCSKKCGGGTKYRRRTCSSPKNGGKRCVGRTVDITQCNTEPCPETKWRGDGRCGDRFRLLSGKRSECNPNGEYPCCSNYGWCGKTAAHCSCNGCTDYRPIPGCHVEVFEHARFKGTSDVYRGSVRQVRHDNRMSSLKVPPGCCVTIYEDAKFRGRYEKYCDSTVRYVGGSWNDKMSSLRVSMEE